jgi:hypothetical protein
MIVYGIYLDPATGRGGLPCLWKILFGFECFGCGLSRAGALLMRGRVHDAAIMNPLIFPFVVVSALEFVRNRRFGIDLERIRLWQKSAQLNSAR